MRYTSIILSVLLISIGFFSVAQETKQDTKTEKFTLSGFLKDKKNGEAIIGANIYVVGNNALGATTNLYGFYSLSLPKGTYQVAFSYIGYNTQIKEIILDKDIRNNIELSDDAKVLDEVVISSERKDENVKSTQMGKEELSIERIKSIPAFMGEVDIIKALQLMPGVQAAGEGNSGIYVRGGGPDQNLVLLDDAVVYNTGHLFGFFSVFNADAVKNVTLIKGTMPANYGGRLSSVIDVQMKEGNSKQFELEGGIGLISSRLTLQAPMQKKKYADRNRKGSILISGRRTYIFDIAQPALKRTDFAGTNYFFYDLNVKANYQFSDKDRLYVSGYYGKDVFVYNSAKNNTNVKIPWGNATATVRYNHLFSDKLFMNMSFIFNDYQFSFTGEQLDFGFKANSGVRDYNVKVDFDYYLNTKHKLKIGAQYTHHRMTPTQATLRTGDSKFNSTVNKRYSHEVALYIDHEFDVNEKLKFDFGFRLSLFQHIGPYTSITGDGYVGQDTTVYGKAKPVKTYVGPEPRMSMRYAFGKDNSFKAGAGLNYQYIHLVSSSNSTLPTDIWVQSSQYVKPQMALQYSVGYFRNFKNNMFEFSAEAYFKHLWNQIEYAESYVGDLNVDQERGYVFGKGKAYGLELFLKKRTGKFNGWIGYTLSRSDRKFADINGGKTFPAKYDRTNDLTINIAYDFNKEWTIATTFVYATGNAITPVTGIGLIEFSPFFIYGQRNSIRVPAYHRMDFSLNYAPIPKRRPNRRFRSSYNISIYNVYNRKNTYFIYNKVDGEIKSGNLKQSAINVSLFPIIPSFTWNFKF
ncbi:MAG: TonB-dependent receptor [Chitinophagales bacterium]|nr:TonB-dependent receptor [Chitinophagales bacterium]